MSNLYSVRSTGRSLPIGQLQQVRLQCRCRPSLAMTWCFKTFGRSRTWPCIQAPWQPLQVKAASSWQVSNYGRLQRPNGTVTSGSMFLSGYRTVHIQGVQWLVHRLVMHAFHGPPQDQLEWQVNHLDGNKTNNRLDNLEYVSPKQNMRHAFDYLPRQRTGAKHSMPVSCRAAGSNSWLSFASMRQAANAVGISPQSVSRSCSQGTLVKGYECQLVAATEYVVEGEEWRQMIDPKTGCPVPGRTVSSLGRFKTKSSRVSEGYRRKDGYCTTPICLDSEPRARNVLVHTLVARAFLGPPPSPEHTQVNHRDGNKSNNTVANLEYATPAQNIARSYRVTPRKTYGAVRAVESRVFGSKEKWILHPSMIGAATEVGVRSGNIHHCLSGRYKQTGGYEFRSVPQSPDLPGEEWRAVDIPTLLEERSLRLSAGEM